MNEENKKLKITANKKIVTFSLIALALLVLVSTSYAYFTAVITGNDTAKQAKVTTGTMALKLHGNTEVGMSSAMPGESTTITFSVENTGTLATTYALSLDQVTNNFVDKSDLVYTITSTNKGGTKTETTIPSENGVLIPVVSIEPNVTQEYTMTITFKETNNIQNDNQGKTFTGRIQIGEANRNLLASKILLDNTLIKETPNFSIGEPPYDKSLTNTGTGLYATVDDDGTSYYFRGNVKNNYVQFGAYDNGRTVYQFGSEYERFEAIEKCSEDYPELAVEECLQQKSETIDVGKKMVWRIVRINGDGTIRMILDRSVDYTYNDNIDFNQSTTKKAIDYWYNTYLAKYSTKIAEGNYCIDTSIYKTENGINYYGSYQRLVETSSPSLKCPTPGESFGGLYHSKVGLLNADETVLVGMTYTGGIEYQKHYLSHTHLISPATSTMYFMIDGGPDYYFSTSDYGYIFTIIPVINLQTDATVVSGDGTESNPYVIE